MAADRQEPELQGECDRRESCCQNDLAHEATFLSSTTGCIAFDRLWQGMSQHDMNGVTPGPNEEELSASPTL
jgi:hypothetical protein